MSEQVDEGIITFKCGNPPEPILKLTKDGFIYKGQLVEDAGEAHRLFVEWLNAAKSETL
jgi:hypothetical protein